MLERFLGYVNFKSRSDASSTTLPSTPEQELNLKDIVLNEENWFIKNNIFKIFFVC